MLPEVIGLGIFPTDDWPTPLTPSAQLVINFALGSDPYAKLA
jgi:hypothetical protein